MLASDMSGLRLSSFLFWYLQKLLSLLFYTNNIVSGEAKPYFSQVGTEKFIILCLYVYAHASFSMLDKTAIFSYLLYVFIIASRSREAPVYGASMHTRAQAYRKIQNLTSYPADCQEFGKAKQAELFNMPVFELRFTKAMINKQYSYPIQLQNVKQQFFCFLFYGFICLRLIPLSIETNGVL